MAAGGARKFAGWLGLAAVCVAFSVAALFWMRDRDSAHVAAAADANPVQPRVRLAAGTTDTLEIPPQAYTELNIRVASVEPAPAPDPLVLSGSLLLDSARLVHVHTRFGGEVVEIGTCNDDGAERPLRLNDRVRQGQLIAVIWSKEVGESKSDLVDALSQLALGQAQLARLKKLGGGIVPEKAIQEAERNCEKAVIQVDRIERTLRSWRLTDAEIDSVKQEAQRIRDNAIPDNEEIDRTWAEVDVRAPIDGVILEKNIAVGDIVNTELDLFQIADLSKLTVMANIYEEDIPAVAALPSDKKVWQIALKSEPGGAPIQGRFDVIGNVIDPKQHTGIVMGWVGNSDGRLKVAQFITATIQLPPPAGEVAIPVDAAIDDGAHCRVFVADDSMGRRVTERKVMVARHATDVVYLRNELTPEEESDGMCRLEPGEMVITEGNVELASALEELRSSAQAESRAVARAP